VRRIVLVIVGVVGVAAAALGAFVWNTVRPTSGARIAEARRGKALILVDLQEDYTGLHAQQSYPEPERLISVANQLIEAAHAGGWPVYLVRVAMPDDWFHRLMTGGTALAGTKGAEFDSRLVRADTIEVVKTKSDSFANPLLDTQLALQEVGELFIAGLDAKFCVKKTIGGALNRGYKVNVVREAIATRHSTPLEEHFADYAAAGAVATSLESAKTELSRREMSVVTPFPAPAPARAR
jgi:nicotinamidase-related amidase